MAGGRNRFPGGMSGKVSGLFGRFVKGLRKADPPGSGTPHVPAPRPRPTPQPPVVNTPSLQRHGHGLPDPRTLNLQRGPDGLVTHINGRPVNDVVQEVAQQRNDLYRRLQKDRTRLPDGRRVSEDFTKAQTGAMHSVMFDRRTGQFFEADNRTLGATQPTNLHPTLQDQLNRMDASARANPNQYDYGHGNTGGFPHPDTPGTHSEVASANQALWAREQAGLPTGPDALAEMSVDNKRLFGGSAGSSAACCANCTSILGGVDASPGKKTTFP